jgi:outer membrane scaffolding protein for murein synthesis (MipA/OmpV family)
MITVVFAVFVFFLPSAILAEEQKPVWEIGFGVGAIYIPDYRGANEGRVYALPYPYFIYRGDIIKVDRQTISGKIFKTDRVLLDVSFYGSVPVDSDKNDARAGMEDLDPSFEIGPALDITIWKNHENKFALKVNLPVRAVFSTDFESVTYEGWIISPRLNLEKGDVIPGTGLNLGVSVGPIFADNGYHDYFYRVKPVYATPWRPAYNAKSGYSGTTLTVGLNKAYKRLRLNAFVSADYLRGSVIEDSPLVKRETSLMGGVSIAWVFFQSKDMVTVDY